MDATAAEFLWSGTVAGYIPAILIVVATVIFGVWMGKKVERPRARR